MCDDGDDALKILRFVHHLELVTEIKENFVIELDDVMQVLKSSSMILWVHSTINDDHHVSNTSSMILVVMTSSQCIPNIIMHQFIKLLNKML